MESPVKISSPSRYQLISPSASAYTRAGSPSHTVWLNDQGASGASTVTVMESEDDPNTLETVRMTVNTPSSLKI